MGLSDGGGGGDSHPTEYKEFPEDIKILLLKRRIPGFKKIFRIGVSTVRLRTDPLWERRYICSIRKHILFLGRQIREKFYDVRSPEAREILQEYKLDF